MELVLILLVVLFVVYKLGLFAPVLDLTAVATRESSVYNRSHKVAVAKRYETMTADLNTDAINNTIKKIDELHFD
jgi:hypothetical protein